MFVLNSSFVTLIAAEYRLQYHRFLFSYQHSDKNSELLKFLLRLGSFPEFKFS